MGELAEDLDYSDYLDLKKDHNDTLMGIKRDEFGRFIHDETYRTRLFPAEMGEGWYQDSKGSLYHYDGVVWDEVPNTNMKQLEYLG